MARYIEIGTESNFPASVNGNKLNFGVDTQNRACLTDSNGITYNFGTGQTTANFLTFDFISLESLGYNINVPGIYRFIYSKNEKLQFPSPLSFVGQTIIIINSDENFPIQLSQTDPDTRPVGVKEEIYSQLSKNSVYTFYSIGDKWRGTLIQFNL